MFEYARLLKIGGLLLTLLVVTAFDIKAEELNAEEIVRRADQVMIGKAAVYESVMIIRRPGLKDFKSKYRTYFKERGQKVIIRVLYPPREIGKDLLLIGNNMWQYVPNIERSVRIAGSQRFLGGDFNNRDMLRVSLVADYRAKLIGVVEIDGLECYYLELKAIGPEVTYDRVNYWVRTDGFVPYREEYVTLSGKKMKSLTYSDLGELGGLIRPRKLTMIESLRPTHRTIVNIVNADYDARLQDSMFTRTYLERKWR